MAVRKTVRKVSCNRIPQLDQLPVDIIGNPTKVVLRIGMDEIRVYSGPIKIVIIAVRGMYDAR